jgi:hypothetical protein
MVTQPNRARREMTCLNTLVVGALADNCPEGVESFLPLLGPEGRKPLRVEVGELRLRPLLLPMTPSLFDRRSRERHGFC